MIRNLFFSHFNVYQLAPCVALLCGTVTYFSVNFFQSWYFRGATAGAIPGHFITSPLAFGLAVAILSGVVVHRVVARNMPVTDIGAHGFSGKFRVAVRDYDPAHNTIAEQTKKKTLRPRFVDSDGETLPVPPVAVYFPTTNNVKEQRSAWPTWCTNGHPGFAKSFAKYVPPLPEFVFAHFCTARIKAVDANAADSEELIHVPESLKNELGTAKHPIIIFSHGIAGHSRAYSAYCCELASMGAVVIAPTFTDGSAIFTKTSPSKHLLPGPAGITSPTTTTAGGGGGASENAKSGISKERESQIDAEDNDFFHLPYAQPPPEGDEAAMLKRFQFRLAQCLHRATEVSMWERAVESGSALRWIFAQGQLSEKQIAAASDRVKKHGPVYCGHSFGGATSLTAAVEACMTVQERDPKSGLPLRPMNHHTEKDQAKLDEIAATLPKKAPVRKRLEFPVILLDLWSMPSPTMRFGRKEGTFADKRGLFRPESFPPLVLLDSEAWERWDEGVECVEFLKKEWPHSDEQKRLVDQSGKATAVYYETYKKTDHTAVSDLGIFSPRVSRKPYVTYDTFQPQDVPRMFATTTWAAIQRAGAAAN